MVYTEPQITNYKGRRKITVNLSIFKVETVTLFILFVSLGASWINILQHVAFSIPIRKLCVCVWFV